MYCEKCGNYIENENDKYCTHCGAKVGNKLLKTITGKNNKVLIKLPYTSGGIMVGYGFGVGKGIGGIGSRLGEGATNWRTVSCYLLDNGLSIDETGDFIPFNSIIDCHVSDEKGLIIKHNNVTLKLVDDKQFVFRVEKGYDHITNIIQTNMSGKEKAIDNTSNMDELMKAKELLEAGLLTEEEFNRLKEKLLF